MPFYIGLTTLGKLFTHMPVPAVA